MPSTARRNGAPTPYGWQHAKQRARWKPRVDNGVAYCTEPICLEQRDGRTRHITPGTPWDLAHNRTTGNYRGPAHRRCNRAEGARYGNHHRPQHNWHSRAW